MSELTSFFGTKDEALVVTNGQGEFEKVEIHALRGARPGKHWVTALERNNDKGAQNPFLVQTNWSQFHFDADGTRRNRYWRVRRTTVGWLTCAQILARHQRYLRGGETQAGA